ncbi:hypothetical protein ACFSX9_14760 [Flavobacterium ardleyense]|uniref:Lipoprotein n=1 Tax=Flavobacterium ardleyense TaxID=2038737 RepID=A0ABW5ZD24_9FLAO
MRKISSESLDSFREEDLKKYSKMLNLYFKRKSRFIFVFFLASCSVQNHVSKEDYRKVPKNLTVDFYYKLDTVYYNPNTDFFARSFVKDFTEISHIDYNVPMQLQIKNDLLFLKFSDKNKKQYVLQFYGKRYKKKFVFYTNYKTITFPFLFMTKEVTKYSIYLPTDNDIAFHNQSVHEGMLLLFGGSSSSGFNYQYKILKDE